MALAARAVVAAWMAALAVVAAVAAWMAALAAMAAWMAALAVVASEAVVAAQRGQSRQKSAIIPTPFSIWLDISSGA
jgi:hypothetical protein